MGNQWTNELTRALAGSEAGVEALRYALGGKTLPSDTKVTEAYHAGLRQVSMDFVGKLAATPENGERKLEALAFLSFADRFRPYSPRTPGNRPVHYWDAAVTWAEAVQVASGMLPGACRPRALLKEAGFVRAYTAEVEIPFIVDGRYELFFIKPSYDARWFIRTSEVKFSHPVAWGVLSKRGVKVNTVRYNDVNDVETIAFLARRGNEAAAACEFRNGIWSKWRVARGSEVSDLSHFALMVPSHTELRLGDYFIQVDPIYTPLRAVKPEQPVQQGFACGQISFDPPPLTWAKRGENGEWTILRFADRVDIVRVSHPDHGTYKLWIRNTDYVGVREIPGQTYSSGPVNEE